MTGGPGHELFYEPYGAGGVAQMKILKSKIPRGLRRGREAARSSPSPVDAPKAA
jgi:hypothetical protein